MKNISPNEFLSEIENYFLSFGTKIIENLYVSKHVCIYAR